MSVADLSVLSMLKSKLKWHQVRQRVLAENIANADTPDFKARELQKFSFEQALKNTAVRPVSTAVTNVRHISGTPSSDAAKPGVREGKGWEVTPSGNAVSLEDQMMKTTQNQMQYQAASTLYSRALGLIRIAVDGGN